MTVQWMPKEYNQPKMSRSEAVLKSLEPLGQVAGQYLQSKMQGYYDQQKEDRLKEIRLDSAKAISSAYKHPEWASALSGLEGPQQISLAKELALSAPSSQTSLLQKLISGGKFEAPEQSTQPIQTPATIAQSQDIANRMGIGGRLALCQVSRQLLNLVSNKVAKLHK